jgi:hypothetical protein
MKKSKHIEIHKELHHSLDLLLADYIMTTGGHLTGLTVMGLMKWSHEQTVNPKLPTGEEHDPE